MYLFTKGIGSCYQGGAKLKKDQEKDLELVMIMAFGYPEEPLERSYEDFRRIELKKLVTIRGAFGKVQRKLLEAARLAPSAMNRQHGDLCLLKIGSICLLKNRGNWDIRPSSLSV